MDPLEIIEENLESAVIIRKLYVVCNEAVQLEAMRIKLYLDENNKKKSSSFTFHTTSLMGLNSLRV